MPIQRKDSITWFLRAEVNLTNKWLTPIKNERGSGVWVLLFGLVAIPTILLSWVYAINWSFLTDISGKSKIALDHATHAAALDFNKVQAAKGIIEWDQTAGTSSFYTYFRKNFRLDTNNNPLPGSFLKTAPIVHRLEFISNSSYPFVVHRTVNVHAGTPDETTRNVDVTIYGPSLVAVVEVRVKMIGQNRSEPIIIPSVANIRFR